MDLTTIVTAGVVITLGIGATYALFHFRKKNRVQLFNQVYESARQVPKQKRHSFLLLMFKETVLSSKFRAKKRGLSNIDRLNNPKYLNIQMMQMGKVLKNKDNVQDKDLKKALVLFNDYLTWEKEKHAKAREEAEKKKAS
jgi:hypothetical protein